MDESTKAAPGWFPNPDHPGLLRYWDGERWTEHTAPAAPAVVSAGPSTMTIARGVALGLIVVIAAIFFVSRVASSNDGLDCATHSAERVQQGLPALDCD